MPNRRTEEALTRPNHDPLAANAHIYEGNFVCLNATNFAVPGTEATGLLCRGIARYEGDNTGGVDGAKDVESDIGAYLIDRKVGDEPTDPGTLVYVSGNFEVAKTATGRSVAGYLVRVDASGQAVVDIDGKEHV